MDSHFSQFTPSDSDYSHGSSYRDDTDAEFDAACAARDEEKEWARKLRLHLDDVRVFLNNGFRLETIPPQNDFSRRQMLAYLKKNRGPVPRWVLISGLWPQTADKGGPVITPESRRKRVRALYKATLLLVRRALARHAVDPDRAERSVFWDPIAEVSRDLDIPPSKLSELLKEHAGHSLSQMIDNVRAERVKKVLRGGIRTFLNDGSKFKVQGSKLEQSSAQGACLGTGMDEWAVWKELKASRKWPEFSQNSWAQEMGFASYRRLYRACVSVYGKTPHQLEMELIREVLEETAKGAEAVDVPDFVEWNVNEAEEAVRGIRGFVEECDNGEKRRE